MATSTISGGPAAATHEQRSSRSLFSTGASFDRFVAFGDSATDTGNVYALIKGAWPRSAYFKGRFSNGPTWIEYLVQLVGARELRDFAYGGVTTDNALVQGWTGADASILGQVGIFCEREAKEKGRAHTRYGVGWEYVQVRIDPRRAARTPNHHVLVMGMVNCDHTPYFAAQPADVRTAFQAVANAYNASLAAKLAQYKSANPRRVTFVPTSHLVLAIFADPEAFGFPRGTDGTPWLEVPGADPDAHVSFDQFHVTTKVHALFAHAAATALAGAARGVEKSEF
ncbi:hypothetical protein AMAG_20414 [Allomyces macrogynus ATCC 38327]|uniref:SGNH hydrolase-type esterase domain-containing protein n=1 Tax=Allomyces macrogynus (strain ATCC 38327) TaxID=578462 RepID=A0A0L0T916_ALLM3|nr:hypothetical protein AMAG_20414 [Allomyces macrogynus ATCC 38327]|eukprot:KNE71211.1 hypothetical protein AMAG_20414 [Allomyces macrogynus ATCC 38327]